MTRWITKRFAPAIGDVRALAQGDLIILSAEASERADWPRYVDAIAVAVTRGAEVKRNWKH